MSEDAHRQGQEASASDSVEVALYRQGFSLERIARATHHSRDTTRRIVVDAGITIRPPRAFRPEDAETITYPPDHPSVPIAAQLRAEDAAARTKWAELPRPPTIRGRWQTVLLDALETENTVGVLVTAERQVGRSLLPAEANAVRNAVRRLARDGIVDLHHVTRADGTGPKRSRMVITRPGSVITPRRQQQIDHAAVSTERPAFPPVDQAAVSAKLIRQLRQVIHTSQQLRPELIGSGPATKISTLITTATQRLSEVQRGLLANQ